MAPAEGKREGKREGCEGREKPEDEWTARDSRVGLKVSVVDGLDQLLRYLDDLLFASCGDGTKTVNGRQLRPPRLRRDSEDQTVTSGRGGRQRVTGEGSRKHPGGNIDRLRA